MKMSRALLALIWVSALSTLAVAQDDEFTRQSLKGLAGVQVVVEPLKPEVEQVGLTTEVIQTDAELKLRLAGIRVLTEAERLIEPGYPYLYLNATVTTGTPPWGYATSIALVQHVRLIRNPAIEVPADTWSLRGGGGITLPGNTPDLIRTGFKDQVDRFINAYLAMNPKKQ